VVNALEAVLQASEADTADQAKLAALIQQNDDGDDFLAQAAPEAKAYESREQRMGWKHERRALSHCVRGQSTGVTSFGVRRNASSHGRRAGRPSHFQSEAGGRATKVEKK